MQIYALISEVCAKRKSYRSTHKVENAWHLKRNLYLFITFAGGADTNKYASVYSSCGNSAETAEVIFHSHIMFIFYPFSKNRI